mmetsp:Transcript_26487/g.50324  ORF Transcript_26487/g.50324 Transcript_26487/m.50324 type:complete len:320 (-) Transcript_26487:942-1901(-)
MGSLGKTNRMLHPRTDCQQVAYPSCANHLQQPVAQHGLRVLLQLIGGTALPYTKKVNPVGGAMNVHHLHRVDALGQVHLAAVHVKLHPVLHILLVDKSLHQPEPHVPQLVSLHRTRRALPLAHLVEAVGDGGVEPSAEEAHHQPLLVALTRLVLARGVQARAAPSPQVHGHGAVLNHLLQKVVQSAPGVRGAPPGASAHLVPSAQRHGAERRGIHAQVRARVGQQHRRPRDGAVPARRHHARRPRQLRLLVQNPRERGFNTITSTSLLCNTHHVYHRALRQTLQFEHDALAQSTPAPLVYQEANVRKIIPGGKLDFPAG